MVRSPPGWRTTRRHSTETRAHLGHRCFSRCVLQSRNSGEACDVRSRAVHTQRCHTTTAAAKPAVDAQHTTPPVPDVLQTAGGLKRRPSSTPMCHTSYPFCDLPSYLLGDLPPSTASARTTTSDSTLKLPRSRAHRHTAPPGSVDHSPPSRCPRFALG